MTRCSDRALKPRQLRTSWTNTGTLKGPARVMEPQPEPPMMVQEVRAEKKNQNTMHAREVDLQET